MPKQITEMNGKCRLYQIKRNNRKYCTHIHRKAICCVIPRSFFIRILREASSITDKKISQGRTSFSSLAFANLPPLISPTKTATANMTKIIKNSASFQQLLFTLNFVLLRPSADYMLIELKAKKSSLVQKNL